MRTDVFDNWPGLTPGMEAALRKVIPPHRPPRWFDKTWQKLHDLRCADCRKVTRRLERGRRELADREKE
jgi:hypothetical protein